MINGKEKGGNYERVISKKLSLWLSNREFDDMFWRTQGSGSRHTIRRRKNLTLEGQAGDIASTCRGISEDFIKVFCVEIKFYKDINIWSTITKSKTGLLDFWKQADRQGREVGKIPLLIVKQNHKPTLLISNEIFNILIIKNFELESELVVNLHHQKIFIWKLEDILSINPEKFMSLIVKRGGE